MGKKHGPEEIIGKLREVEIVLAQGETTGDAAPPGEGLGTLPAGSIHPGRAQPGHQP